MKKRPAAVGSKSTATKKRSEPVGESALVGGHEAPLRASKKSRGVGNAKERAHSATASGLISWLQDEGAIVDGVQVEEGPAGRRLVATRTLEKGFTFLKLPEKCAITTEACLKHDVGRQIANKFRLVADPDADNLDDVEDQHIEDDQITHRSVLYAFLMVAENTFVQPYLEELRGRKCLTPFTWSAKDRQHFPDSFIEEFEGLSAHLLGQYNSLFPSMTVACSEQFPSRKCAEESWYIAHSIYTSRAVKEPGVGPDGVLLPVFDFLNHDSDTANVEWLGLGLAPGCGARVTCQVKTGEELLYSYGLKSNAELTLSYGFAIWDNPEEVASFRLNLLDYGDAGNVGFADAVDRLEKICDEYESCELSGAGEVVFYLKPFASNDDLIPALMAAATVCLSVRDDEERAATESPNKEQLAIELLHESIIKQGDDLMSLPGMNANPSGGLLEQFEKCEKNLRKIDAIQVGSNVCAATPRGCAIAMRSSQLQLLTSALDVLQNDPCDSDS